MDIEGIIVNKVEEKGGISNSTGEPWKRAKYIVNINGGSILFDAMDGKEGRISKLDSLMNKRSVLHMSMNAQMYNGRWYMNITCFGGHVVEDTKTTNEQPAEAAPTTEAPKAPEAPAAPAPTPEPTPAAEPAQYGPIDDLPF